ncbi:siroheme synthase CysG [Frigidibacter sp. ROC022]|uniref:siroheme synthase CysG n=1 Tax=Frigidibacter sp. ROC022 TaxID=2971796 RepID=UPI00215B72AE|nr:siroheme synthase CysG [Frigidibacter sp. ROC022]MCR8726322.1 siroheme synthase CysG [Frigidibacter sp. ROC022]
MQHFPIFLDLSDRRVVLAGGGDAALAKLRLLLRTGARITVHAESPAPEIAAWADAGRLILHRRRFAAGDAGAATLVYGATEDPAEDARVAAIARAEGALVNIVDDLAGSDFLTPAIVDRSPVTIAIGTEGAAPVLARMIKADLEDRLPAALGPLARIGKGFRKLAAALPHGRARRAFWAEYYDTAGPRALARGGEDAVRHSLGDLLDSHLGRAPSAGHVDFVGAGPGDPELLTLKARKALDRADVVIHDRLVPAPVLELARREARIIAAGKQGFGPSVRQDDINALIVEHGRQGLHVVRLKSGDPTVFGRLDEELDAVIGAGLSHAVIPGITAASAAVAALDQSQTRRGRNAEMRLITGHDMQGYAEHDWRALARPGAVAAIYMARKAARFVQGRLLMHGADPATPVSIVENASRPDQRILACDLAGLDATISGTGSGQPAIVLVGLAPREAARSTARLSPQLEALS